MSHCLPTLIDLRPKLPGIKSTFFPREKLILCARTFIVSMSLSLISGKLNFCHDVGYIVTIESYAPMVVKRMLFATCIASLLLVASFNTIFSMHAMSLLLGALFNTEVVAIELYT